MGARLSYLSSRTAQRHNSQTMQIVKAIAMTVITTAVALFIINRIPMIRNLVNPPAAA
jgi:hypothetical protein